MDVVEARAHFHHRGETIRGWALRNGFSPALVYAVLAGRITGVRGQAHHIAVALDLKPASPHLLRLAAAVEAQSEHPLARAVVAAASGLDVPQAEGVAVGPRGEIFLISEPNLFYRFDPPPR